MAKGTKAARKSDAHLDADNGSSPASDIAAASAKKPCRTCGREMTPDAKQIAKGNEVEMCSHSCRIYRVGKRPNQALIASDLALHLKTVMSAHTESSLPEHAAARQLCLLLDEHGNNGTESEKQDRQLVDVDAWIELTMLDMARTVATVQPSTLATCEDVEASLQHVLKVEEAFFGGQSATSGLSGENESQTSSDWMPPLQSTLSSGPGPRERVRRSARRLFILPAVKWACRSFVSDEPTQSIDVLQRNNVVDGLQGVSFAKGTMQIRLRQR